MSSGYHEIRYWSVTLGSDASRLFMFDAQGQEHFAIVPMIVRGRRARGLRDKIVNLIAQHIEQGRDPGEIEVNVEALLAEDEVPA